MNIACVPYHDWRKIETEGSRTRDAHMMQHLAAHPGIKNIVVVNRPITHTEIYLKKKNKKITGQIIFKEKGASLYKIKEGLYVFDFISSDLLGPVLHRKKWFLSSFGKETFYNSLLKALRVANLDIDLVFTQNIFSAPFVKRFSNTVFDAWDNFLLFPENQGIYVQLKNAYQQLADNANRWITNSPKNVDFYKQHYRLGDCLVIKNGVDIELFSKKHDEPADLKELPRPIIGFGGKITHLFDYELFNKVVVKHPDKSFVIVGQILDKEVFSKINMASNVHYLGDKNYRIYPSYVTNFDVGIIPYVTNHLEHGADSIKVYEYIAAGLGVVGTNGAGMNDMARYMYVAENNNDFSEYIDKAVTKRSENDILIPQQHTWSFKVNQLVRLFNEILR